MVKKNQLSLLQVKTNQIFEILDLHKYSSYFGNIHAFNLTLHYIGSNFTDFT